MATAQAIDTQDSATGESPYNDTTETTVEHSGDGTSTAAPAEDGQCVEPEPDTSDAGSNAGGGEGEPEDSDDDSDATSSDGEPESSDAEMSTEGGSEYPSGGDEYPSRGDDGGSTTRNAAPIPGFDDLLQDSLKQAHQPSHGGDLINVAGDDIPGTVSSSAVSGPFVGHSVEYGVADPAGPAGGLGDEGQINGAPGEVGPGMGNGDLINDLDQGSQHDGPEERNTQHDIKHDAPAAANADASESADQASIFADFMSVVQDPAHAKLVATLHSEPAAHGKGAFGGHDFGIHPGEESHAPQHHDPVAIPHEGASEHHTIALPDYIWH